MSRVWIADRRSSIGAAALCVAAAWLALCSASAPAAQRHVFAADFGSLAAPVGVAVNQSTGHVYIAEAGAGKVDDFDASGTLDGTTPQLTGATLTAPYGVAVDNSTQLSAGDIYVADNGGGAVHQFNPAGAATAVVIDAASIPLAEQGNGTFTPTGVAVDPSGDVYVADSSNEAIDKFSSSGVFIAQLGAGQISAPQLMATDALGDLYVASGAGLVEFDPTGGCVNGCAPIDAAGQLGVAVDAAGDVYAGEGSELAAFDAAGAPLERFGSGDLTGAAGIAVDNASGAVYVADSGAGRAVIFNEVTVPDASTAPASNVQASTGTLNGNLDPVGGGEVTDCHFEWGTDTSYGQILPCAEGNSFASPASVHANLVGLTPNTSYHFRLDVANANGQNSGQDESFTTPIAAPRIDSSAAVNISAEAADLHAQIDPGGAETTYSFQYVGDGAFKASGFAEAQSTPMSASIGSDASDHLASAHIQGLIASTTYHYRAIATNSAAPAGIDGAAGTFTTQAAGSAFALPDGRVWEMVSPPDKNGGEILPAAGDGDRRAIQAAPSGEAVAYSSLTAFAGAKSSPAWSTYLSSRGSDGWSTRSLNVPLAAKPFSVINGIAGYDAFSSDLTRGLAFSRDPDGPALAPGAVLGQWNLYVADNAGPSYQTVSTLPQVLHTGEPEVLTFGAATPDFSHVVYEADDAFCCNALNPELSLDEGDAMNVYEWSAGQQHLVDILPDEQPAPEGVLGGGEPTSVAGGNPGADARVDHAISSDGSKIFWTDRTATAHNLLGIGQIYMRENATRTVPISASQRTDCADHNPCGGTPEPDPNGPQGGMFWTASADGSKVFFTSCEQLTNDSTAVSTSDGTNEPCTGTDSQPFGMDLYEYDTISHQLVDLTVDPHPASDQSCTVVATLCGANVQGVVGASEDGSYVYFVATGDLASGASSGHFNLYLWHEGTITFIAGLSEWDATHSAYAVNVDAEVPGQRVAYVTPNGHDLTFDATASLTGYDNTVANGSGNCGFRESFNFGGTEAFESNGAAPAGCQEVYLYDSTSNQLICASCNPTGAEPLGPSTILPWTNSNYDTRALSDDGSRLFFTSLDSLVPHDVNDAFDVYEWEREGAGSCSYATQVSGGCLYLISTGTSPQDSVFADASASGDDVFFTTTQALSAQDTGTASDLYDARVGGSEPAAEAAPCANSDSCKPPVSAQPPIFGAPASATFSGAGDVSPQSPVKVVKAKKKGSPKQRKRKPKKKKRKAGKRAKRHGKAPRRTGRGGK
jgi:hypothetical protein